MLVVLLLLFVVEVKKNQEQNQPATSALLAKKDSERESGEKVTLYPCPVGMSVFLLTPPTKNDE